MILLGVLGLSALLALLSFGLSKKRDIDREKLRPFECGFIPKVSQRESFSIQFFLVALLFLVFDLELVLLFPYIVTTLQEARGQLWCWFRGIVLLLSVGLVLE